MAHASKLILLFLAITFACLTTRATTYTAASCSYADVNSCFTGSGGSCSPSGTAANGDTVIIPATGSPCTWTTGITISGKGIDITGTGTPNAGGGTTGAGSSNTTLIDNASAPFFTFTNLSYGQTAKVELLTLSASGASSYSTLAAIMFQGSCTSNGCANVRVDNITFASGTWYLPAADGGLVVYDNVFGVIDHNTTSESGASGGAGPPLIEANNSAWAGTGSYGNNSFYAADSFGTAQAMYVENNSVDYLRIADNDVAPTNGAVGGDRIVCRFNTVTHLNGSGICGGHGTAWGGYFRGERQVEAYYNSYTCSPSSFCNAGDGQTSGTGYYFSNSYAASAGEGFNTFLDVDVQRTWRGQSPWLYCDGNGAYDNNTGTVYASGTLTTGGTTTVSDSSQSWTTNQWQSNGSPYSVYDVTQDLPGDIVSNTATQLTVVQQPYNTGGSLATFAIGDSYEILKATGCIDQTGTGRSTVLLSGSTPSPTGWVGSVSDPVYQAGITITVGGSSSGLPAQGAIHNEGVRLASNRDYYGEVSTSAQSSATSPFNGTSGTGYGTLANRPTTCTPTVGYWATDTGTWNTYNSQQGTLYLCETTNTWTAAYTPYTYPHPLDSAGATTPTHPSATGLLMAAKRN